LANGAILLVQQTDFADHFTIGTAAVRFIEIAFEDPEPEDDHGQRSDDPPGNLCGRRELGGKNQMPPTSRAPSPNQMTKKAGMASSAKTSRMPTTNQCHHSGCMLISIGFEYFGFAGQGQDDLRFLRIIAG
jgi:hypothetical protein